MATVDQVIDTEAAPRNPWRPTKYSEQMLQDAKQYLSDYKTKHGDVIPSVEGMASALNVGRSTLYVWAKDKDTGFQDIMDAVQEKQLKELMNKGLDGSFNPTITRALFGKHGIYEKTETDVNMNLGGLSVEQLELMALKLLNKAKAE